MIRCLTACFRLVDRLRNLCIKSELSAGREGLKKTEVLRSPNGTPIRPKNPKEDLNLRLETDPQFNTLREGLQRRFNESGLSDMDSVRSDWSATSTGCTPR